MKSTPKNSSSDPSQWILSQAIRPGNWNTLPKLTAVITAMLGLVVLMGWLFSIPLLKSVIPGAVEMKVNTAIGLVLSAFALFILSSQPSLSQQRLAQALALAVAALGLATLGEYQFGWQPGIDELLFKDKADAYNVIRGRMSPLSSVAFALIGLALTAMPKRSLRPLVWLVSISVMVIGTIVCLGYLWNASELVTDSWLPPVAVNTAVGFALLGIGLFNASMSSQRRRVTRSSIEIKILVGFITAFVLLILVGGYSYRTSAEYAESAKWVTHTQQVRIILGQLYSLISDAESAQRSYLLTSEQKYKAEYKDFLDEINSEMQDVTLLIDDNSLQKQNLAELKQLAAHRIDLLDKHLTIFEHQGYATVNAAISSDDGIETMHVIRKLADKMDAMEEALLVGREAAQKQGRNHSLVALLATLAVSIVILIVLFAKIRREIFSRSQMEEQLKASSNRIGAILDNVVDGIITINQRGLIETFNPSAEELFGYAAAEAVGQNVSMLMPEPHERLHDKYIERYTSTGEKHIIGIAREVVGRHKSGSTFPMELAVSEMKVGEERHFTGIAHDITLRKQAEELLKRAKDKAENANRAKDSFLATMSHEIRTPLGGMLGMMELLSLTSLDNEQRSTLETAWESGRGLLRIVSDILDWSKIEEGKLALAPRSTSIQNLLQEVVNTYSRIASAKSLKLWQHSDARLSSAHIVDGLRLSQVLNNFVSNAIKFTQHGEVELNAELVEQIESGERIRFSVKDTGIGIPKEVQPHLFQRYRQESEDTARMYGGTGLGLAICRRLAELMDGQVELASESEQGSTFSITLVLPVSGAPVNELNSQNLEVAQRAVKPLLESGADAPLVLAVDDHPINRDMLARQVRLLGLRAETAENGRIALSMWRDGNFALVITDCHMPEMDGYELTRSIRMIEARERLPRTPIIAWTANALAEEDERCRDAGMDDMMVKPANLSQLKIKLARWLSIAETDNSGAESSMPDADADPVTGPIDFAELKNIVPDRTEQILVLHDFQSHIRVDYDRLLKMLEQGDQVDVERTAHRMKGSCRMVGAKEMANASAAIEQAARDGNMSGANAIKPLLGEAIKQFEDYLEMLDKREGSDED